ncbi:ABC transporter transmembrane domain-containing protein [Levilactobacillus namurensis]|uniref:ABC transporter transmembrane domain-containing protein n=1 Tax=Levilactobacillus namurensis TaxID=380393 RepID=UPI001E16B311|nr:ABC transporter ATP-binding protein [Levilactobacillus namurensis]HJE44709.1 ABC transporter ATP-binding protein/permease [Levilactobacillus namurensis]
MLVRRYWHYARYSVGWLLLLIPIASAIEIAVAALLQLMTDAATGHSSISYGGLVAIVGGYILVDAGMFFGCQYLTQTTLNRMMAGLRQDLLGALFRQPTGVGRDTQALTTTYYNDFTTTLPIIRQEYLQGSVDVYRALWQFLIAVGMSVMIQPWLSLLILALCLPGLGVPFLQRRRLQRRKQAVLQQNQAVTQRLQDATQGLRTIQIFNVQRQLQRLFNHQSQRLWRVQNQDQWTRKAVSGVSQLLDNVLYLGTWVGGIYFVMQQTITLGQLVAFSQLMIFISEPIQSASGLLGDLVGGRTAVRALEARLAVTPSNASQRQLAPLTQIAFNQVGYASKDVSILQGVSLTLQAQQHYVIVGKSGSGKSTLLNLPLSPGLSIAGTIQLNQHNLEEYSATSVAQRLGLLTQEVALFDDTIANNLSLYQEVAEPRLQAALRLVGLDRWATSEGVQQAISRQGTRLSGGERHRLAVARLWLQNKDFSFLDEPLTGLDPKTAHDLVQVFTTRWPTGWALVTHQYDATLFAAADQIIVVDAGRIVARGTQETAAVQHWLARLKLTEA